MFVGRERELQKLESMYESDQFEFAVFYGRRRVGKTTLTMNSAKIKRQFFSLHLRQPARKIWNFFRKLSFRSQCRR